MDHPVHLNVLPKPLTTTSSQLLSTARNIVKDALLSCLFCCPSLNLQDFFPPQAHVAAASAPQADPLPDRRRLQSCFPSNSH